MDTQDSTMVSWHRQMARQMRASCSGITRGLSLRRAIYPGGVGLHLVVIPGCGANLRLVDLVAHFPAVLLLPNGSLYTCNQCRFQGDSFFVCWVGFVLEGGGGVLVGG